jgi:hypothetical protein
MTLQKCAASGGSALVPGYEVKGFHFRGILAALEQERLLDEVRTRLPPDILAFVDRPPLAGAWVDGRVMDAMAEAVRVARGPQALRKVQKAAVTRGAMLVLKPVVESVMRVLGVAPSTILGQLNRLQGSAVRGVEHEFRSTGPSGGTLITTVMADVPDSFFEGTAGSMEALCELCGATARVATPTVVRQVGRTVGTLELSWSR